MKDHQSGAPRNKTLRLSPHELVAYSRRLLSPPLPSTIAQLTNRVVQGDSLDCLPGLPTRFVDLLFLDPPYNLTKRFASTHFRKIPLEDYRLWFESWFVGMLRLLKPTATVYVCADWRCSSVVHEVLNRHTKVRSRITWEREKGRGAKANWKNASEDIWFATLSDKYCFNVDSVKLKRRVVAPYRINGQPKDWHEGAEGQFRITHPSNLWTDVTVPFWSMPENTNHPTQKPEKLIAKLLLASSCEGDFVLDPFLGSGTTAVVAQKLGRLFLGIELDRGFACLACKRLELAMRNPTIQGYVDGVFWERNSMQNRRAPSSDTRLDR